MLKQPVKKIYEVEEAAEIYPIPFNHCINPDRKFVVRTFNHTFEQLNEVSYLSNEMLEFFDPVAAKQLRD